ncbi:MAG TPA: hypothetical protein VL651_00950, partial [Bacteroidia bacterium]|nr:hypothetical protein [Bacteroidia bacterium]
MRKAPLLLCLFFHSGIFAQNLVLNPGFEEYSGTSLNANNDNFAAMGVSAWYNPTQSSSDFSYSGENAHSGQCSGGFYLVDMPYYNGAEYREYAAGTLSQPLVAGTTYRFSMAVTAKGMFDATVSEMGIYFTPTKFHSNTEFEITETPQIVFDNVNQGNIVSDWIIVSGTFTASGGEKYFVVGNFLDNAHSHLQSSNGDQSSSIDAAYYYIDDLCLKGLSEPVTSDENQNGEITDHSNVVNADLNVNYYQHSDQNNNNNQRGKHSDMFYHPNYPESDSDITCKRILDENGNPYNNFNIHPSLTLSFTDDVTTYDDQVYYADNDAYIDTLSYPVQHDSVIVQAGANLISYNIYFDYDESVILADSYPTLDDIVAGLKD